MRKFAPVVFLLVGLAAGAGAGIALKPKGGSNGASESQAQTGKEKSDTNKSAASKAQDVGKKPKASPGDFEYLKLSRPFVVPVVESERIAAMVMMSLSLEVVPGISDSFYSIEPKLRDRFLQVLFDHANTGGFDGNFTNSDNLAVLRKSLLNVARKEMGGDVTKVLITSVNRQDT